MAGHTLDTLGKSLRPPVTRIAISKLISPGDPFKTEKRIKEVSELLHESDVLLFPFEPVPAPEEPREGAQMSKDRPAAEYKNHKIIY